MSAYWLGPYKLIPTASESPAVLSQQLRMTALWKQY